MEKINLIREVRELKTHLSYSKNIGFFFGAGTSCALKIPNVEKLTAGIEAELKDENKSNFNAIKEDKTKILYSLLACLAFFVVMIINGKIQ
jgi:NAD-dependent SIR2 family protein deacetylase